MAPHHDAHKRIQEMAPLHFWLSYLLGIAAPNLALIIASFTILAINWGSTCGIPLISLPVWLLVFAIVETLYLIESAVGAYYRAEDHGPKALTYGLIVHMIFLIIWNIIGACAFYDDSAGCQTNVYSLWAMTFAVLCLQWIIMGCWVCICCCWCCKICLGGKDSDK
jgi:hypothetical protein